MKSISLIACFRHTKLDGSRAPSSGILGPTGCLGGSYQSGEYMVPCWSTRRSSRRDVGTAMVKRMRLKQVSVGWAFLDQFGVTTVSNFSFQRSKENETPGEPNFFDGHKASSDANSRSRVGTALQ